jgi:diguanylate cyclase (GGDEF)-like protein
MLRALNGWLGRIHPLGVAVICLLLVAAVALLDYVAGYELSLSLLYLGPVALSAWYLGRSMGFAFAVLAAAAWILDDILMGHEWELGYARYWNAVMLHLGFFVFAAYLVTRLRGQLERERKLARTDGLTGALNWRAFVEEVSRLTKLALRGGGATTLVYLDVDDFKGINDTQGHAAGDRLLQAIHTAAVRSLRDSDVVARLGGDEFGFLLPMTDENGARTVVERTLKHLADAVAAGEWHVTFSIGVVTFPFPPQDAEQAIRAVDALMYKVKNGGKNGVAYETAETTTKADQPGSCTPSAGGGAT